MRFNEIVTLLCLISHYVKYVKEGVIGVIFMVNGWGVVLNNRYTTYKYTYICVRVNNTHLCAES